MDWESFLKLNPTITLLPLNLFRAPQQVWAEFTGIFLPWEQDRLPHLTHFDLAIWMKTRRSIYWPASCMALVIMEIVWECRPLVVRFILMSVITQIRW